MPGVSNDLDKMQRILGDAATIGADGLLWSRAELLTLYCDSYRQLLTLSQAVRRWTVIEVPEDSSGTFALPVDHERIVAIYFDHRRLQVAEVRELDAYDASWPTLAGYPLVWTTGVGRTGTFAVYMIPAAAGDRYNHAGTAGLGVPRRFSGHRSYAPSPTPGLGIPRNISSPDRQYLATIGILGTPRRYRSSRGNLFILEVIGPGLPDLLEGDTPGEIPRQMRKYLVYGGLARAFEREGEGARPDLAALCQSRFDRGVQVMQQLSWLSRKDETFERIPVSAMGGRRPPRVQFPPNYPRVWR